LDLAAGPDILVNLGDASHALKKQNSEANEEKKTILLAFTE
jgi:metallophosphoesterase superfamily enzyme